MDLVLELALRNNHRGQYSLIWGARTGHNANAMAVMVSLKCG